MLAIVSRSPGARVLVRMPRPEEIREGLGYAVLIVTFGPPSSSFPQARGHALGQNSSFPTTTVGRRWGVGEDIETPEILPMPCRSVLIAMRERDLAVEVP
jgi:hypothetical protein